MATESQPQWKDHFELSTKVTVLEGKVERLETARDETRQSIRKVAWAVGVAVGWAVLKGAGVITPGVL